MTNNLQCTIGTSGKKWGDDEKQQWLDEQTIKRSYQDEVISKIEALHQEKFQEDTAQG